MSRELRVAPEVASALPAPHLAQLGQDALGEDNVCVACGALIEGPAAELVVLHDERALLARLAHPACARSGVYAWPGTSAAIAGLALRPDGLDVATALVWRPHGPHGPSAATPPRALVLLEPRLHVSLDGGDADPHEQLFAAPLGLHPVSGGLPELNPPSAPELRLRGAAGGLALVSPALRISIPARADTLAAWRARADGGRAIVILGRGLGITRPDAELAGALAEALAVRPCWAATVPVD
jgi:hypothetical protein